MGHQMPTDIAKAHLSMKYLSQDDVAFFFFLLNRENRQEAQLPEYSAIFILGFPVAFLLHVYSITI